MSFKSIQEWKHWKLEDLQELMLSGRDKDWALVRRCPQRYQDGTSYPQGTVHK